MKNTQATIRDLALKLNISISTVSRALRNAPDVNSETKKAVHALAKELSYEPNRVAQSLRIKKTNTIGVVVPEIAMHFFSTVISGIQEYAAKHDYTVMICQSMESLRMEKTNLHTLVSNRVDGLLISLSYHTKTIDHLQSLVQKQIPVVLFDRVIDGIDLSKVVVDDHDGAFKAVRYLVKTGCKRIAYIGGPKNLYISEQRLLGYIDALKEASLEIDEDLIIRCSDLHDEPAKATLQLLGLQNKCDAIFCMNDPVAILVMQTLKSEGIRIPEEISIVGFTNEPVSQYIEPSLTTVAQPASVMGQTAIKLLLNHIEHKGLKPTTKVLATELIVRGSTRGLVG